MERGTGGEHVVDKDGAAGGGLQWAEPVVVHFEGIFQVVLTCLAAEGGLGAGGAGAAQAGEHGKSGQFTQSESEFVSLVEMAGLDAVPMKWDGDEWPLFGKSLIKTWVMECFAGDVGQAVDQVDLPAVFQTVDQVEGARVAAQSWAGEVEGELDSRAVFACEGRIDAAVVGFAADGAEWLVQARQGFHAGGAERLGGCEGSAAERTFRRIDQVEKLRCNVQRMGTTCDHEGDFRGAGRPQNT